MNRRPEAEGHLEQKAPKNGAGTGCGSQNMCNMSNVITSSSLIVKDLQPIYGTFKLECKWWQNEKSEFDINFTITINPSFALDIFICSFRKCIQHTTRGQSNFPWSKLCCCYIFIVLKYWWQNSITAHIYANCDQGIVTRSVKKWGKRSNEGFRGIIFLLYWPRQQA